ncbi:hypothetical protein IV454_16205 [Massilia antarctica]|uniref:Uncharacterized protein n=1 Tax=Massilia antarctica TaxID=2765360 RepID=A0AA48WHM1_9BURK|nr:hypothetical protein [Massilia antarctica]QPI52890.1 hypothetical protein IV454_16205 [Massilia antarctica]
MTQLTQGLIQVKISEVLGDAWLMPAGADAANRMREVALVLKPADARRLAACWNAFDGMALEHIESIPDCGVNGLVDYAADHKRECGRLRDELEAAGAHDELVRELDVMLNGRGALAPTLFDIVQQVRSEGITSAYPQLKPSGMGGDEAAWRAFADAQPAVLDRLDGGPLHSAWFDGLRPGRFTNAHLFYLATTKGGAA